jgi:DNA repair ATPase RecN
MDAEAIEILREIRDEARQTNARLDQTNARLDQVVGRLDGLDSAMRELGVQQRFVVRYVKAISERETRLDDELSELRLRVELIEARLDPSPP